MTKNELKQKLLDLELVEDNEYLDKYVDLIISNSDTKRETYKTQKHHIIPRYYFKYEELELDDSKLNIVNLIYKDHVLAHYYLIYCSTNYLYKRANICAVNRVVNALKKNKHVDISDIENLDELQKVYEESKHISYFKDDTIEKIRMACKGSIFLYKDGIYKYVKTDNLQEWFDDGWIQKHPPQSDIAKQKLREKAIGKIYVHKDNLIKRICPEEKELYLSQGFELGQGPRKQESFLKNKIGIHKDGQNKFIDLSELDNYLQQGYTKGMIKTISTKKRLPHSKESYQKMSLSKIGRIAVHKNSVIKYINPEEKDSYLSNNWILGTGNFKSTGSKGKIWIHNEQQSIYILPEEKDTYLNNGWVLGRLPKKKRR